MTQTLSQQPRQADLIAYEGPSVAGVAPSVTSQIPYPTNAPQNCSWVVVANSSPYTVLVQQGQVLGQVAAFTSDLFPVTSGAPLNVTPQPTAGSVAAGSDTTVYSTWYLQKPPGSYPAALGSGATNIQVSDLLLSVPTTTLTPTQAIILPGPLLPPLNVAAFASTRMELLETGGLGPLQFVVQWLVPGGVNLFRQIGVMGGGQFAGILPNLSDQMRFIVTNNDPVNANVLGIEAYGTTQLGGLVVDPSGDGILVSDTTTLLNGGTRTLKCGPFPGPVNLVVTSTVATGGLGWKAVLTADGRSDNTFSFPLWSTPLPAGVQVVTAQLLLPSVPVQLVITNALGVTATFATSIIADTYRVG